MTDPHTGFIIAAYAIAFAVICTTIVALILDYRAQCRALSKFGARSGLDETS